MLAAAVAAFALLFVVRELGGAPGDGVSFLYVIPIVLIALEYGPGAGVAAGLAAVALFAVWDATTDNSVTVVAYLTRTVSFVVVGWLTGRTADRLRAAGEQTATAARHFEIGRAHV